MVGQGDAGAAAVIYPQTDRPDQMPHGKKQRVPGNQRACPPGRHHAGQENRLGVMSYDDACQGERQPAG